MRHNWAIIGALGLLLAACGGSTDADGAAGSGGAGGTGGVGGSGGGSGGATGGSAGMPQECSMPARGEGPYPVTFRFTNSSATPLFVLGECHVRYDVTSCADGYQAPLSLWGDCTVDCASPEARNGGCLACGACMHQGIEVTSTKPYDSEWGGNTFTFGNTQNGCQCHNTTAALAGLYRIGVPVYASDAAAQNGDVLHVIQVPFTLPAPGGIVEVPLAAQADQGG